MKFITNDGSEAGHAEQIKALMDGADQIVFSVAFVKKRALETIESLLIKALDQGGSVTAYCGTDFFLTEPQALEILLDLKRKYQSFSGYVLANRANTFHPKLYLARHSNEVRLLVGSCNLTNGALNGNVEASILTTIDSKQPLFRDIETFLSNIESNDRCTELDELWLRQYASKYSRAQKIKREVEKATQGQGFNFDFDVTSIKAYWKKFKNNPRYLKDFKSRRSRYTTAKKLQKEICDIPTRPKITKTGAEKFRNHLNDLMSSKGQFRHLWSSDAIYRQGSKALNSPKEMIALFRAARDVVGQSPAAALQVMLDHAKDIPGVGVNMATEILATFDPKHYAVLNQNTTTALKFLGFDAPDRLDKHSLKPKTYQDLIDTIAAIGDEVGAQNLLEADALLNFIYWDIKS